MKIRSISTAVLICIGLNSFSLFMIFSTLLWNLISIVGYSIPGLEIGDNDPVLEYNCQGTIFLLNL